jgi:nucleotide-binding universal stress UspA family protein
MLWTRSIVGAERGVSMTTNKVLIPLDGSASGQQILPHVQHLLDPATYELILLRVAQRPAGLIGMPPRPVSLVWPVPMYQSERDIELAEHPIYASQVWQNVCAMLEDELVPVVHDLQAAGYVVSVAVRFGEPIEEIVTFVETEHVNLVAMATRGWAGLRGLLLGSVAEGVLQRLQVPVLLVRPFHRLTSDESTDQAAALDVAAD